MNIGFLITNWEEIDPNKSSTLRVVHECVLRKHKVFILYPQNLTVRNNIVHGFVKEVQLNEKISDSTITFYKKTIFKEKLTPLHAFDCIFIRKDPPIDSLILNFLDSIKSETLIINDIEGLRKANNKLYTTTFHDPNNTFLPITHVSKNKGYLQKVIDESKSDKMILKPLDGSGGRGVIVLEKNAPNNISSLLDFYINRGSEKTYVIIQDYIEGAEQGDIRVLMLNGVSIGAYRRVPAKNEVRANIHAGGTAQKYVLTEKQKHVLKKIGPKLVSDGLYFVGVDMIGEKILEINVCNPGGISNINRLNKVKLQKKVVDFIEEKVHAKKEKRVEMEYLLKRLSELRNT
ncbi:MAG: glutathione synthase [Spirochaetia bacterium]|nr:glutathione synthase [Spirochaetia bacterium]